jgi:hypothetical protein
VAISDNFAHDPPHARFPRGMNDKGRLSIVSGEFELVGMLFHQLLEASERYNLPERHMYSICTGLGTEDSCSFINEPRINSD